VSEKCKKMGKNSNFYTEYARFGGLIKHYARKSKEPDMAYDLWHFLYELVTLKKNIPNDRYIAVCIRNRFITLNKKRCVTEEELPLIMDMPDTEIDIDLRIDMFNSVERLPKQQRRAVYEHYYEGKTFEEIAKETNRTRQAIRQNCVAGVVKMRDFFIPKN
jgi:RNA polymerase sigma factor (sigma-70 family)